MADNQPASVNEWATYRRLLGYAAPYKGRLLVGVVFGALFGFSLVGILLALQRATAHVFGSMGEMDWRVTLLAVVGLPVVIFIRGIGDFTSKYLIQWVGQRVVMDLRNAVFSHLQALPLKYYTSSRTGELISRTVNDTAMVERTVSSVVCDIAQQPFALLAAVGYLIYLDGKLAFASLVLFPICILPVAYFGRRVRRSSREGQELVGQLMASLQESIAGVRIVKAFAMEGYEIRKFVAATRSVFTRAMRVVRAQISVEPIIVFISVVGLSLVLVYARWAHMGFDAFFAFGVALVAMYEPVKKLSRIHLGIQQGSAAADRVFELLDSEVSIKDKPGAVALEGPVRTIDFDNVFFAYDQDKHVLENISFSVKAGQRVAFVGGSGSGKTTLVSLIPRFYDVTGGALRINRHDVRDVQLASLRGLIGMVTQDTFLFNDTIAGNIAYGMTDCPMERIIDAARRANAHEFIAAMPEGYQTVIGERGVRLSGGQCQRLSIARALLRNPPILILDEATSALDTESERQVQAALDDLMQGRTVFAIAHRLSTVAGADRIYVLDQGIVAEQGTHQELLARGGLYRRLYDLQFSATASTAPVA